MTRHKSAVGLSALRSKGKEPYSARGMTVEQEIADFELRKSHRGGHLARHNPSVITNRYKRLRVVEQMRLRKARVKHVLKERREREREEKGEEAAPRRMPDSIDRLRLEDETMAAHAEPAAAEELLGAEAEDEFKEYFQGRREPKVAITTSEGPQGKYTVQFCEDLVAVFGGTATYVPRGRLKVYQLCGTLIQEGYTSAIIVHEDMKKPTYMMMIALPEGPTAWFRLTSVFTHRELVGAGNAIPGVPPEVILTNFRTRLGRRVARMLQNNLSLHENRRARQVITFHNQRDFIFFRAYRYVVEPKDKKDPLSETVCRLHELGPQFTLQLRWLQSGLYDIRNEEYEFFYRPEAVKEGRRKMLL